MLELRSVSKSYPEAGQVLREVSLRVEPGQALCLAGGNAEGKTTLLEIAAGLRRPDSGEVLRPAETALVPQRPAVLGELTAADNLALWYAAAGQRERPFSPGSPEEKLGLSPFARRRAGRLSGGMQRRLSIAAALCSQPGTLLLDEPFAALDAGGCALVHAVLADFVQAGGAGNDAAGVFVGIDRRAGRRACPAARRHTRGTLSTHRTAGGKTDRSGSRAAAERPVQGTGTPG